MRGWGIPLSSIAGALALSGCALVPSESLVGSEPNEYLVAYADPNPTPDSFRVCHGYGCKLQTRVALSEAEWQRVRAAFKPRLRTASGERRQISAAIAIIELEVGQRTGTAVHQRREPNRGDSTQLDCIDESVNTWTYLTMLAGDGLLSMHRVGSIEHGGSLLGLDMRNTAIIELEMTGTRYAVDPWLVDVGAPPPILPLSIWLASWPPQIPGSADARELPAKPTLESRQEPSRAGPD
ncbi:MAG: hypothetical protein ACREFI_17775 [Stellaceae bacterium]